MFNCEVASVYANFGGSKHVVCLHEPSRDQYCSQVGCTNVVKKHAFFVAVYLTGVLTLVVLDTLYQTSSPNF